MPKSAPMAIPKKTMPTPIPTSAWTVRLKMSGPAVSGASPAALSSAACAASRPLS
jgi:hypothetical protein